MEHSLSDIDQYEWTINVTTAVYLTKEIFT